MQAHGIDVPERGDSRKRADIGRGWPAAGFLEGGAPGRGQRGDQRKVGQPPAEWAQHQRLEATLSFQGLYSGLYVQPRRATAAEPV
ncbi:hypothetical protein BX257_9167 [Streptomyces sp. 3212.3]|nr:hypothetical protein BX257_9167 [Streptomyces sp. 3212.3]